MLSETEQDGLRRYCALLRERLGDEPVAIRTFLEQVERDEVDVWSSR